MYIRPQVTLALDLLTPKVNHIIPLLCGLFVPTGIKISSFVLGERYYFTFTLCHRISVCLSVCRLSVCNVGAPHVDS